MSAGRTHACTSCYERPGSVKWYGNGGALAVSHGMYSMWCEHCVNAAQIEYVYDQLARLPELLRRGAELTAAVPLKETTNHE